MDQLREDTRERTWEDYVEVAGAALAVGAGAALFLRNGGAQKITNAAAYMDSYRNSLARNFLENPVNSFKTMERTIRDNFSRTMAEVETGMKYRLSDINPNERGSINDLYQSIRTTLSGVSRDHIRNDLLTSHRKQIARDTLSDLQDFAMANQPDFALTEQLYATVGRIGERMAKSNVGLDFSDVKSYLSASTNTEEEYNIALNFAKAIHEELQLNQQNTSSAVPWVFNRREVRGFLSDGSVDFGGIVSSHGVDQETFYQKIVEKLTNWEDITKQQQEEKDWFSNLVDNVMGRKAKIGELIERADQGDQEALAFFDKDHAWPIMLRDTESTSSPTDLANIFEEFRKYRNSLNKTEQAFFDQYELDGIRVQDGHIYSTKPLDDLRKNFMEGLGNTMPGRIFRLNDINIRENVPSRKFFAAGTMDPVLAKAVEAELHPDRLYQKEIIDQSGKFLGYAEPEGLSAIRTETDIINLRGRSYMFDGNDLVEIESLRDYTLQSSRIGSQAEIFRAITEVSGKSVEPDIIDGINFTIKKPTELYGNNLDTFTRILGLDKKYRTAISNEFKAETYGGMRGVNRIGRLLHTMDRYTSADALDADTYKAFNQWYKKSSFRNSVQDTKIDEILDLLENITKPGGNQELYRFLGMPGTLQTAQSYKNPRLLRLISDYWKNPQRTVRQGMVHADQAKLTDATAYVVENFQENARKELTKELFIRMGTEGYHNSGITAIEKMVGSAMHGKRKRDTLNLAGYALFEHNIGHNVQGQTDVETAVLFMKEFDKLTKKKKTRDSKFILDAFESVNNLYNFKGEATRVSPNTDIFHSFEDYHYVHKAYGLKSQARKALDLIKNANKYYWNKSSNAPDISVDWLFGTDGPHFKHATGALNELLKPITQFISGGDRFDAYSTISHIPYHMMNRVDEQLNQTFRKFGYEIGINLGLKQEHKKSAADIMANLVLRRVLPGALIYNALDWTDDFTRAVTGTGIAEAGLSGLANTYLGVKKLTGAIGLDPYLKSMATDNSFVQYWGGMTGGESNGWNTYEEQKDYYERGYTPIRKNRFWWFGSSNEFRGNKIAYWEPNTLRMMRSNYFMESMYKGSMWKKWSHSLMPTPTNPLSPLFYLLDPYYLEKMHKEDRPYPITGSTFAENTPWGVALNPIFDTFIKPKKQMYRDRLNEDGVDVRALIAHINEDIKRRSMSQKEDNIIYLQNGKLRSMLFTAFNAPTPSTRIVGTKGDTLTTSTEYGSYGSGISSEEFETLSGYESSFGGDGIYTPSGGYSGTGIGYGPNGIPKTEEGKLFTGQAVNTDMLTVSDRLVLSAGKGNPFASQLVSSLKQNGVFSVIKGMNMSIKQRGALRKDQGLFYENKMQYESSTIDDMLADSEVISDLMTQGKGNDYVHEMTVATRNITGLYGYLASVAFGYGENNQKRIATSQNMESFSRQFWDWSVGGMDMPGSDRMEIIRRFIPNYQRQAMVNPLMNDMPDWLPERMRFGDPFASIPKGEARLPGRGYESLNQLHPDIYGRYGAFDRFKILADVAPYSPEYKFWKKVAGATVQDPELKKEIQEIKARVAEQTKGHDFYDYKYIGRGLDWKEATISEISRNGRFKIDGSDQYYKLSGVSIKAGPNGETTEEMLGKYIYVGQKVSIATDENIYYARNNDKYNSINAGIIANGVNVAEEMLKNDEARKRKGDTSASSYMINHGMIVNAFNTVTEALGHFDVPVFHSRWFKTETPLESYKDDYVYGVSYQDWSRPWSTYIKPNFQKFASDPFMMSIGIGMEILNNNIQDYGNATNYIPQLAEKYGIKNIALKVTSDKIEFLRRHKYALDWATRIFNRGQLAGRIIGHTLMMGGSASLSTVTHKIRPLGSMVALGWAAAANPNNLLISTMATSRLGWKIAEMVDEKARVKAAGIGAFIGAARWLGNIKLLSSLSNVDSFVSREKAENSTFWGLVKKFTDFTQKNIDADDNANTYIPDETRQRWDMQEYFDRLTYIKYMGLYEQAADKAESEEGVNIRRIIRAQEREREERFEMKEKLREQLKDLRGKYDEESVAARNLINQKLKETSSKMGMRGGEWTKTAIMYKNAADATIYGLSKHAVMEDIVRALPKTERDYFIEFMKEKDPDKRKEILRTVSPMLARALRTIWKMPVKDMESNEDYFEHHTLPAPTWSGWRPNVDLANVEAKVIYNQGMKFSDMGIYASQYRTPEVQNAPNIEYSNSQNSTIWTRMKLQMAISGTGIDADTISIEPQPDSKIQVIANVARIVPYKISDEVNHFIRRIF